MTPTSEEMPATTTSKTVLQLPNGLRRLAAGTCCLLLVGLLLGSVTVAADYQPVLPKTSPTKQIVVVDVLRDWQGHSPAEGQSALLAISCLQGLVNRDSETKIYLVNFPWRLWWDWSRSNRERIMQDWFYGLTADAGDIQTGAPAVSSGRDERNLYRLGNPR